MAAGLFALPMIVYGPMVRGYDTREHLNYAHSFSDQFWSGEWYPRWLMGIHHGLGSPTLFVYPPLPSFAYALIEPVGRLLRFDSFRLDAFLALLVSGLTAFLWLKTIATERIAVVGAVLYMLMPYHLAVDYYRRAALAESWALAWVPMVFYFLTKVMDGRPRAVIGLAIAFACVILSNVVTALMFSFAPVVAAILPSRNQRFASAVRTVAGMLLGGGLASFYLLPALAHAKYFPVWRLPIWPHRYDYLLSVATIWQNPNPVVREIALDFFSQLILFAVCGGAMLVIGHAHVSRIAMLWVAICIVPAFLMTTLSSSLWTPRLFEAFQFPWRFSSVLCVAALPMFAEFAGKWSRMQRGVQVLSFAILTLIVGSWFMEYGAVWSSYLTDKEPTRRVVNEGDGWFYAWTAPGLSEPDALQASLGPRVRFLTGTGTAKVLVWKPRHLEVEINSSTGGWIMLSQFYYPAWRAELSDQVHILDTKAAMPSGLTEVLVPPGANQLRVEIPTTRSERIGGWLSWSCVLVCLLLAVFADRPRQTNQTMRDLSERPSR